MHGDNQVIAPVRDESERRDPHPVYDAFMDLRVSRNFSRDDVRRRVIPAYMGLIKQIDDQLGPLFAFLDARGLTDQTMIVVDPLPRADATRGTTCDALVEAIDLAPTFVEYFGGTPPRHILEGRSLMPLLRGQRPDGWRRCVFSEYDYSMQDVRQALRQPIDKCRLFMAFDGRWKYIHAPGYRPMLFDLQGDPHELRDLGTDPAHEAERQMMKERLFEWALTDHNRITTRDERIAAYSARAQLKAGALIGYWDETELKAAEKTLHPGCSQTRTDACCDQRRVSIRDPYERKARWLLQDPGLPQGHSPSRASADKVFMNGPNTAGFRRYGGLANRWSLSPPEVRLPHLLHLAWTTPAGIKAVRIVIPRARASERGDTSPLRCGTIWSENFQPRMLTPARIAPGGRSYPAQPPEAFPNTTSRIAAKLELVQIIKRARWG